jgi:hypothetical protein
MSGVYTFEQLVDYYVQCRDKLKEIDGRYDNEKRPVQQLMEQLENAFMAHMQSNGLTSFKTNNGTAYLSTRTTASVADWETFFKYAMETNQLGLLTHGANAKAVEEFIEANKAQPPGLNVSRVTRCNVRRD